MPTWTTPPHRARKHGGSVHHGVARHPKPPDRSDFQVNKLFVAKDGNKAEHIWIADVKFTGNRFVGVVDNKPA